jgi:chemotaxis protein methyltransferase CheR
VTAEPTGSVSPASFEFIRRFLRQQTAIELSDDKVYLVNSRLGELARELKLSGPEQVAQELQRRPHEADLCRRVAESLTTNETFFFRDNHPFTALREDILPKLLEANNMTRCLRIWCAACSTGQEPYSLAMMLTEHFSSKQFRFEILATDIDTTALSRASEGCYKQHEMSRGLPAIYLAKYFHRKGALWEVAPIIKKMIRFQQLNLAVPWPSVGRFELILLRNVLIYFSTQTKADILVRMSNLLAPRGVLLLGAGESTVGLQTPLERFSVGATSCYRRAVQVPAGAT